MATYKSTIAYDGTEYRGFQRQKQGIRTVQSVLEQALRTLGWNRSSIKAAGRTDTGVHARGQVIAYTLAWKHEAVDLTRALNANLPPDVAVFHTECVTGDFHPRFSARSRWYRYSLILAPVRDPLRERFAWRVWPAPDMEVMQSAAQVLVGRHDFGAFGQAPIEGGHTEREVLRATWDQDREHLHFDIEADAFLYRMVRRIVGALIEAGCGRATREQITDRLADPSVRWEGSVAEAKGLCLEAVYYE